MSEDIHSARSTAVHCIEDELGAQPCLRQDHAGSSFGGTDLISTRALGLECMCEQTCGELGCDVRAGGSVGRVGCGAFILKGGGAGESVGLGRTLTGELYGKTTQVIRICNSYCWSYKLLCSAGYNSALSDGDVDGDIWCGDGVVIDGELYLGVERTPCLSTGLDRVVMDLTWWRRSSLSDGDYTHRVYECDIHWSMAWICGARYWKGDLLGGERTQEVNQVREQSVGGIGSWTEMSGFYGGEYKHLGGGESFRE
ncbi:hypothetical protein Tco_1044294 [Tanacetum coccineum]|uniref:Uncharacterized protein n=1 Tax=Tanacetum coccineum TaxID=301880 RepID=A0ABQ5GQQ7_9ASTR